MPRKRMIDPEFWSDEEIGQWPYVARLFYIGLWNFADDEGRFKAHPSLLKSQIFPYDSTININKLKGIVKTKIQWYSSNDSQYGHVRNFLKYQRIDRPTPSKLPTPGPLDESSTSPQEHLDPNIKEVKLSKVKLSKEEIPYDAIIADLNTVLNTDYRHTTAKNRELISARWKEGFRYEDFRKVHRNKHLEWSEDEKMHKFLRPETLYSGKFEGYLNQRVEEPESKQRKKSEEIMEKFRRGRL